MAQLAPQMERGRKSASLPGQGQLPRFPCQLFVHCVASLPGYGQLAGHVPGVDKYGERAMLLAESGDFVCLAHQVSNEYLEFLNHLELGPDPAHIIRLPVATSEQAAVPMATRLQECLSSGMRLPLLRDIDEIWLNSFAASEFDAPLQCCLAKRLGHSMPLISQHPGPRMNLYDKHIIRQHAHTCGLPLPPGESVTLDRNAATLASRTAAMRRAISKHLSTTGRVIVRGALGASGSSVFVMSSDEREIQRCLQCADEQGHTDTFLVEPFFDVDVSPNIGMFIDPRDGAISYISVTDQILDDEVRHFGNHFPSEAQLVEQMVDTATRCCHWLRDQGTTGFLGFDFCEYRVPGSGQRSFFFAELNPRLNGATYPSHLLDRLNAQSNRDGLRRWRAFRAVTIQTNLPSFSSLQTLCRDLLFNGQQAAGIIPYNVGLLEHGKLMLAMVGESASDVAALENELSHRLTNRASKVRGSSEAAA